MKRAVVCIAALLLGCALVASAARLRIDEQVMERPLYPKGKPAFSEVEEEKRDEALEDIKEYVFRAFRISRAVVPGPLWA